MKNLENKLSLLAGELYHSNLASEPLYGVPLFAVQSLINKTSVLSADVDSLGSIIEALSLELKKFDSYPHYASLDESDFCDSLIETSITAAADALAVCVSAMRYKHSFNEKSPE